MKCLGLEKNNISNINVFKKVKFDKLETLWLDGNKINKDKYSSIISSLKSKIKDFDIWRNYYFFNLPYGV